MGTVLGCVRVDSRRGSGVLSDRRLTERFERVPSGIFTFAPGGYDTCTRRSLFLAEGRYRPSVVTRSPFLAGHTPHDEPALSGRSADTVCTGKQTGRSVPR